MTSSRSIDDLHPSVKKKAQLFTAACKAQGIDVLIYRTYASLEAQAALYEQGRTTPGPIVTNAKPGQSMHNYRCAFDAVPMLNGKPLWDSTNGSNREVWQKMGRLGESVGLEWSGRWNGKLREMAHFQYTGGYSIQALKAGAIPK